jgi:hypothetical protein
MTHQEDSAGGLLAVFRIIASLPRSWSAELTSLSWMCNLLYSILFVALQPKHRRIRRWDVLWAVFNMGVRFMELYKRRMKRIEVYQRCATKVTFNI